MRLAAPSWSWLLSLSLSLAASACGDDGGSPADGTGSDSGSGPGSATDGGSTSGPTTGMTDPTGGVDSTGADSTGTPPGVDWTFEPVYGVVDLDDDDRDGAIDFFDDDIAGDDDLSTFELPAVPAGSTIHLEATGDLDMVRVWHDGAVVVGWDGAAELASYDLEPGPDPTPIAIDFGVDVARIELTATLLDGAGAEVDTATFEVLAAPLMLQHNLQITERAWVLEMADNAAAVAELEAVLGANLTKVDVAANGGDRWLATQFAVWSAQGAQGQRATTAVKSVFQPGPGTFAANEIEAPGYNVRTWGPPAGGGSGDALVNFLATPPLTSGGVEYPLGRILYVDSAIGAPNADIAAKLDAQGVQAPWGVDQSLLIAEPWISRLVSFVPDPSGPKGFKVLMPDPQRGIDILQALDGAGTPELPKYLADFGYAGADDMLADVALVAANQAADVQLNQIRADLQAELGLVPSDFIAVPVVMDDFGGLGTSFLTPRLANPLVVNLDNGEMHAFFPDPFIRANLGDQGSDAFISALTADLPAEITPHFVDDWAYHVLLGGFTDTVIQQRAPDADWWDVASHLLPGA